MMEELPDMTPEEYDRLRDDIAAHGLLMPILVDTEGNIIDGHHRARACVDLHIDPERKVVDTDDPVAVGLAVNSMRRHLSPAQLAPIWQRLLDRGWSRRQVAAASGVGKSTVHDHTTSTVRDRTVPLTVEEVDRRRDWVVYWREQGASYVQIMASLDMTESQVSNDLKARGMTGAGYPRNMPSDPEPVDWRSSPPPQVVTRKARKTSARAKPKSEKPPPPPVPAYQRSTTLQLWGDVVRNSEGDNAVNRLANDAAQAGRENDEQWIANALDVLREAFAYLERLRNVVVDDEARDRAIRDWQERDDMRKGGLRAVK